MKPAKNVSTKAPQRPLNPQPIPLHGQTDPTTPRDKVREVTRVNSPRESKRPVERLGKGRGED